MYLKDLLIDEIYLCGVIKDYREENGQALFRLCSLDDYSISIGFYDMPIDVGYGESKYAVIRGDSTLYSVIDYVNLIGVDTSGNLAGWLGDDYCEIYAWVWGGSYGDGQWVKAEIRGATTVLLIDLSQATGLKLVRVASGAAPAFSGESVHNNTGDITLSSSTHIYDNVVWYANS